MQIMPVTHVNSAVNLSILKSANEQPNLAGELINKTVEGLMQTQLAQVQTPLYDFSALARTGSIINTAA